MNVLHINQSDTSGGAAIAGYRLHSTLLKQGIESHLLVGRKLTADARVDLVARKGILDRGLVLAGQLVGLNYALSLNGWHMRKHRFVQEADVVNLHNLHSGYLNYLFLKPLVRTKPIVFTLHDMWGFTGHCAYSFDCERWRRGCGACPDRRAYPGIYLDNTRLEHRLKRRLFGQGHMVIVAPSRWLTGLARQSLLGVHRVEHIPNGLDLEVFRPLDNALCREVLGIPRSPLVLCFAAEHLDAARKGGALVIAALKSLSPALKASLCLLTFGHRMQGLNEIGCTTIELGYLDSDRLKAMVYSAADAVVLPSLADNLPLVLQEAMACGTPLIGFDTGGVPDLVRHDETGLLVETGNVDGLASAIFAMMDDDARRVEMSRRCADIARTEFDILKQAERYAALYTELRGRTD